MAACMNPKDWRQILEATTGPWHGLCGPISEGRLEELCARLAVRRLPESYASFLLVADGGWVGDRYVYGSAEIELLVSEIDGLRRPRLLPFHPVDRHGIECLELGGRGRVVWCRSDQYEETRRGAASIVHPLAQRVIGGSRVDVCEATYTDFTDWVFDALQEAAVGAKTRSTRSEATAN